MVSIEEGLIVEYEDDCGAGSIDQPDPSKTWADAMSEALDRAEARVATLETAIERHRETIRRREAAGAPIHRQTQAQAPNEALWSCLDD